MDTIEKGKRLLIIPPPKFTLRTPYGSPRPHFLWPLMLGCLIESAIGTVLRSVTNNGGGDVQS